MKENGENEVDSKGKIKRSRKGRGGGGEVKEKGKDEVGNKKRRNMKRKK